MKPYHKIDTIFKREHSNGKLIVGDWSKPEFEYLKDNIWTFDEKVDGTNIRVGWDDDNGIPFSIKGRTENAQIPAFLNEALVKLFDEEKLRKLFPDAKELCLYGEGYGRKIQKVGSLYIPDGNCFCLFDIRVGNWWLLRKDVEQIGESLGLKIAPIVGEGTLQDSITFVQSDPKSTWGDFIMEGLILRPKVPLTMRSGERVITKIKVRDYKDL